MLYQHTQVGRLMLFALLIVTVFFGFMMPEVELLFTTLIIEILILLILAAFSTLTVTVDENILQIKFRFGLFKKSFLLKEITSATAVKNPWYYGWGIHWTAHGWLYNVSGFDAVEIVMKNGKKCRIGTDEPEKLVTVVSRLIKQ